MNQYFIGLMLASSANSESGVAIIDRNNEIITLDKLSSMQDIQLYFENFPSLKNSRVCVSLPSDNSMLNGKWRIFSKLYQLVNTNSKIPNNNNWTQRYSNRGSDFFGKLYGNGINLTRFELYLTRQSLNLNSCFKERSPADCKALQSALRLKYGFSNLPTNMMPMVQLEALTGAILAKKLEDENNNPDIKTPIFEFNGIPVIRG